MAFALILIGLIILFFFIIAININYLLPALILINIFVDFSSGFVLQGNYFGTIRHIFNFVIIFSLAFQSISIKNFQVLYYFIFYIFLVIPFSSDPLNSLIDMLPFLSALLLLPISMKISANKNNQKILVKFVGVLLLIYPIYILSANIFNFGGSYSDKFSAGFLVTSGIYSVVINIVLAYYILKTTNFNKIFISIFIVINTIVLIINLRRTAILGLFIAFFILLYNEKKRKYIFVAVALFIITIFSISYFFEDVFVAQINARQRILETNSYQEEGRFLEFFYLIDHVNRTFSYSNYLFGYDLMNTTDFGKLYFRYPRSIHSDYLNIFYGSGFVGLLLLLSYIRSLHKFISNKFGQFNIVINKSTVKALFVLFVYFMMPGRLIGNFTTVALIFIYLGMILNNPKILIKN